MLSSKSEPIDQAFFKARLEAAKAFRDRFISGTNAYRLVHGEADFLPGLVIDRYAGYLTVQTMDQGMDAAQPSILAALGELLHPNGIVARNDVAVRKHESLPQEIKILAGEVPEKVAIEMNGLHWEVNLLEGQKTGVFLDQRENYATAAHYAKGHALDCFTCTGGFALYMAKNCESVEAIDSSEKALATAEANAKLNQITNVRFKEADVFDLLARYDAAKHRFDTIILDPPAFAKSRNALEDAARGYKEINLRALKLLKPGGVLITCSCSHHFTEAHLLETLAEAALDAHRTLRILDRRTQAQDHPILLTVPETHYLKCLITHAQ